LQLRTVRERLPARKSLRDSQRKRSRSHGSFDRPQIE
jgi:hypothetical protein